MDGAMIEFEISRLQERVRSLEEELAREKRKREALEDQFRELQMKVAVQKGRLDGAG